MGNCQTTYETVERTIMVPEMFTENRTVDVVECRMEERQMTRTYCRPVTETNMVTSEITVPSYETRTREVAYTVCRPVITSEERQVTVMVPHDETMHGTRRVCRMVPTTEMRTVCEDKGSWQQVVQNYTCRCGCCCGTQSCITTVWVPNIQSKQVACTVMRPTMEDVPYDYTVTACRPETRTQTVQVCSYVNEPKTRQVEYTVCLPKQQTVTRPVVTCKMVEEQQTVTCHVPVSYTVQKQVAVQVCRMVPKKITCQVPVTTVTPCAPCAPETIPCPPACGK
jgi:hypothetical protein